MLYGHTTPMSNLRCQGHNLGLKITKSRLVFIAHIYVQTEIILKSIDRGTTVGHIKLMCSIAT